MVDLTTTLFGTLAVKYFGSTSDINLCSLASTIIGRRADAFAMDRYETIRAHFRYAAKVDPQQSNHHLARGTLRAALLSTLDCLDTILESEDAHLLSDRFDVAPQAARKSLTFLISNLESAEARGKRSVNQRDFEAALIESALMLRAPELNQAGNKLIGIQHERPVTSTSEDASAIQNFSQARDKLLPGIDQAIIKKMLEWGGWQYSQRSEVAQLLTETMFAKDELWLTNFGIFYAAELRQDTNLYRIAALIRGEQVDKQLDRIDGRLEDAEAVWTDAKKHCENIDQRYGDLDELVEKLSTESRDIADQLKELKARFELGGRGVFVRFLTPQQQASSPKTGFAAYYFAREEDKFLGRERVLGDIRRQLLDQPSDADTPAFAWTAICGDAAMGKSRLAFQLLLENAVRWRMSGFVRKNFVRHAELALSGAHQITDPTLFILDYAGTAPEKCAEFIDRCDALAASAKFPIRVIVLVRRPSDRFFDAIKQNVDGDAVLDTQVRFEYDDNRNLGTGALMLESLTDDEIVMLMRARMAQTAKQFGADGNLECLREVTDDKLKSYLVYIDSMKRPLFAAMVAEAYQLGEDFDEEQIGSKEQARLQFFWDYLEHQYNKRWCFLAGESPDTTSTKRIAQHITFAILSTMCRGLTEDGWQKLHSESSTKEVAGRILPMRPDDFAAPERATGVLDQTTLLPAIAGAARDTDDGPYPILEPDLIGESLVLLALNGGPKKLCADDRVAHERRKYLRELAWIADPDGAAFFAGLVSEDFPEHARRQDWLLPNNRTEHNLVAQSLLLRNLASVAIDAFRGRAADVRDLEVIEDLLARFDFSDNAPDDAIANFAKALAGLTSHVSFIVNKGNAPDGGIQRSPLVDPIDVGRRIFDGHNGKGLSTVQQRAAVSDRSKAFDSAARETQSDDGMDVYRDKSDSRTVEKALEFLQAAFDIAEEHVFGKHSLETRLSFVRVIGSTLSSLFWKNRHVADKFGYATKQPTDENLQAREAFADSIEKRAGSSDTDEATLGIVAKMVRGVIYAEDGTNIDRGEITFRAVCRRLDEDGFSTPTMHVFALGFLDNYVVLISSAVEGGKVELKALLEDIYVRSGVLTSSALKLPDIRRRHRREVVEYHCRIAKSVARAYESLEVPDSEIMQEAFAKYLDLAQDNVTVSIGSSVVELFCQIIQKARKDQANVAEYAGALSRIAEKSGFSRHSLNDQSWANMFYSVYQMLYCDDDAWQSVYGIIGGLARDAGKRVRDDLADALLRHLTDGTITAERAIDVIEIADPTNCQKPRPRYALFVKCLESGMHAWAGAEVLRWWQTTDENEDVRQRTLALREYALLIKWLGIENDIVRSMRGRLLKIVRAKQDRDADNHALHYLAHDAAAADAAAIYARLELAAGDTGQDWVTTLGELQ